MASATGQFLIELDLYEWDLSPNLIAHFTILGRTRRVVSVLYRLCELTDVRGWPPIIGGGLSIPTNNRAGITTGGTRYFMVSSLLEKRLAVVVRAALQFTEEYGRHQGKADEQHHGAQVFLSSRIGRLSPRRGGVLVHWQEPRQSPGDIRIVQS